MGNIPKANIVNGNTINAADVSNTLKRVEDRRYLTSFSMAI
jgi:hypothetical protein